MATKVFIPNRGAKHDFSPAKEFGELVFVSDGYVPVFKTGYIYRLWTEALQHSEPTDYIVICSLNIICSIGTGIFAYKHGRMNLLVYRPKQNKYEARIHILED
jgi:hypothetical protein